MPTWICKAINLTKTLKENDSATSWDYVSNQAYMVDFSHVWLWILLLIPKFQIYEDNDVITTNM